MKLINIKASLFVSIAREGGACVAGPVLETVGVTRGHKPGQLRQGAPGPAAPAPGARAHDVAEVRILITLLNTTNLPVF